jgi:hypothetical protein
MDDNLVSIGQLGIVITKLKMAEASLEDAVKHSKIEIEGKYFLKELIYLKNNLIMLQEKLKNEDIYET